MRLSFGLALDLGTRGRLDAALDGYAPLLGSAERAGYTAVFAGETFPTRAGGTAHLPAPLLALAALAPRTSLRLGTGVTLLPLWQPLRLAYEAAVLDQLCGGRLILGVGAGSRHDWARWGVDPRGMGDRLDESLAALKALWSGSAGFEGRLVQIQGGIGPLPAQPGGPPLWVGGLTPRSARRAAQFGEAWYGATQYRLEAIAAQVERYRAALVEEGKDPRAATVSVNRLMFVADTADEAERIGWPAVRRVLDFYIRAGLLDDTGDADLREQVCLVGSPEDVRRQAARYAAAGVTHFQLRVAPADLPLEHVQRSAEVFGALVLPAVAGQGVGGA
jgi:alkanesulfonate monooxygenase SsuD/methylene tetrahydromethanopterin reductase-like flavin-dependent oxidoreductase (luciferase family)